MTLKIVLEAILGDGFTEIQVESKEFRYFTKLPVEERHLVVATLTDLPPVTELNERAKVNAPPTLVEAPSFSRNTDLILLYQLGTLAEYERYERQILEYEEDKYSFKKYFLYFSSAENTILTDHGFEDIKDVLNSSEEFHAFKRDRSKPSIYAFAARMFIKLPFLRLEIASKALIPLQALLVEAVEKESLSSIWELVSSISDEMDPDPEDFIRKLIDEELEIIKTTDSGIQSL